MCACVARLLGKTGSPLHPEDTSHAPPRRPISSPRTLIQIKSLLKRTRSVSTSTISSNLTSFRPRRFSGARSAVHPYIYIQRTLYIASNRRKVESWRASSQESRRLRAARAAAGSRTTPSRTPKRRVDVPAANVGGTGAGSRRTIRVATSPRRRRAHAPFLRWRTPSPWRKRRTGAARTGRRTGRTSGQQMTGPRSARRETTDRRERRRRLRPTRGKTKRRRKDCEPRPRRVRRTAESRKPNGRGRTTTKTATTRRRRRGRRYRMTLRRQRGKRSSRTRISRKTRAIARIRGRRGGEERGARATRRRSTTDDRRRRRFKRPNGRAPAVIRSSTRRKIGRRSRMSMSTRRWARARMT
mmetsp:Transcript_41538/g.125881  ORF Transcript_41538/g.125881 Transcript_41538/m.125881 type:complete len:356 (-) Transcript_41538:2127-3194(-)